MADDEWSVLRRSYTGPRFAVMLLALIAFALPYVGKSAAWVSANRAQQHASELFDDVAAQVELRLSEPDSLTETLLADLRTSTAPHADALAQVIHGERTALIAGLREARSTIAEAVPPATRCLHYQGCPWSAILPQVPSECASERWRCWRVWQLTLGASDGWFLAIPTVLFILYNCARAFVTLRTAAMRDAEERTGYSPYFLPARDHSQDLRHYLKARKDVALHQKPIPVLAWVSEGFTELRLRKGSYRTPEAYGGLYVLHRWFLTPFLYVAIGSFLIHAWHWMTLVVAIPN